MKLTLKFCAGCIYNEGGTCTVPPGRPRTLATIRLCRDAGWRVRRQRAGWSRRSSAPTGRWADALKGK